MMLPSWLQRRKCPVPECPYTWRTKNGLRAHLYNTHRKADLIESVLKEA